MESLSCILLLACIGAAVLPVGCNARWLLKERRPLFTVAFFVLVAVGIALWFMGTGVEYRASGTLIVHGAPLPIGYDAWETDRWTCFPCSPWVLVFNFILVLGATQLPLTALLLWRRIAAKRASRSAKEPAPGQLDDRV